MADQRFLNFIDMINGGGAGRAGSRFEGGGLLSLIGNALGIRPYGYEDRLSEMRPQARPTGLLSTQGQTRPQARPQLPMTGMDETLVPGPIYSGRGDVGMPRPSQMPAEIGNSGSGMGVPYPATGMDEGLAGAGMARRGDMIGMDPNRIQEFANWMIDNYGTQTAQLSQSQLEEKYRQWIGARTGYRF